MEREIKMKKRYAIVRVDNICPPIKMFCSYRKIDCKNCLYGDTKEQMIRKVATVFGMEKIIVAKDLNEYKYKLAKEIVEFLGVEE